MASPKTRKEIVKMLLNKKNIEDDGNEEELMELLFDEAIAIDVDKQINENETWADKLSDKITEVAGSWGFILSFSLLLILWIVINSVMFTPFDEFPFILLNLFLSCIAALQAPVIMMSQNRSAKKDSLRGKNDYKTDLKSELILEQLHDQIRVLQANQNKILKLLEKNEDKDVKGSK